MNITLTAELIKGFEDIKSEISALSDVNARKQLIRQTCRELCSRYNSSIADNTMNIIDHYMAGGKIGIDELIRMLTINSQIDYYTVQREEKDGFDKKFGTTTSLILRQYELPESVSLQRFQTSGRCHPSPVASVKMALRALVQYNVQYNDFVFIDVGAGLGRNLLLAADYPFKKIIGIEHSAYLNEITKENIEKYQSKMKVASTFELNCIDALEYPFPKEHIVFYFWRPFSEEIAAQFVKKLELFIGENTYRVILIFLGQVYLAVKQSPFLELQDIFLTPDIIDREGAFFPLSVYSNK
jgi:hypothetical protein